MLDLLQDHADVNFLARYMQILTEDESKSRGAKESKNCREVSSLSVSPILRLSDS